MSVHSLCVVHLVRVHNNIESFITFIDSYKRYSAGVSHDLVIVFKGFSGSNTELAPYRNILGSSVEYNEHFVSDEGFDITAYINVMSKYQYDAYCFLNSHSQILAQEWLSKLYKALMQENVGLVGATGSYQSMYTDQISPGLKLPSLPKGKCYSLKEKLIQFMRLVYRCLDFINRWVFFAANFRPFPNPHIRTNAFMISRATINKIKLPKITTKMDAWIFESGRSGLTSKVKSIGKKVLIVGKNGQSYDEDLWPLSGTYKQADQLNLMISDNQTMTYQHGDLSIRKMHANYAWGCENLALINTSIDDSLN